MITPLGKFYLQPLIHDFLVTGIHSEDILSCKRIKDRLFQCFVDHDRRNHLKRGICFRLENLLIQKVEGDRSIGRECRLGYD